MGEHAYPPRMLLKLWLFGAIAGVYSGREIARRLRWDLRFRYLAGGLVAGLPDDQPVPDAPPRGLCGGVSADGADGAGIGAGEAGPGGDRRDEDSGEHVAPQGDEPRADEAGGGAAGGRDRADPGADGRAQRGGGRRARGRRRQRRSSGGAAEPGAAGREAAGGARAAGGGARIGAQVEQPEELCGPRCEHDDDGRGLVAVLLQRAGRDERGRRDRRRRDHDLAPRRADSSCRWSRR